MGIISRLGPFYTETFPPASKFKTKDIPDLSGKVALVTGANTGVGYHTVKALLEHNAKVYLAARSRDKALAAIERLKTETGGKEAIFHELNLGSLADVKHSAEEFKTKEQHLHILINNAGVMTPPLEDVTADGYDLQFGTNVLGHFYLTKILTPLLESAAKSSSHGDVRVVNVSSSAMYAWFDKDLSWDTLKDGPARRKLSPMGLYAQSKVGNVLFANEFARRYGSQGIVSSSLNPGNLASDLRRHSSTLFKLMYKPILYHSSYGALSSLWAATSPEGRTLNGKYLIPWARIGKPISICENEDVGRALWDWCEEQISNVALD